MIKVYLAGGFSWIPSREGCKGILNLLKSSNKLDSYFAAKGPDKADKERFEWLIMKENKVNLFLDSGAFSAWNSGSHIDIDDYIQFCLKYLDVIEIVANLDVIPGRPYQKLTQKDIDDSAEQGWKNYEKMLEAGIPKEKLIHIFHQGEDMKWLKRMVKEIPYIGISPANDKATSQKIMWLDECMKHVIGKDGMPLVKFHGFAVTSLNLMMRYPWYSVDSTSWVMTGRNGSIYVPRYRNGKWIYDENSWKISVSSQSPDKKEAGKHIDNLPPAQREVILNYIHDKGYKLGKSEFKKADQSYKLKENEKWAEKKPKDKTKERLLEIILEEGISNRYQLRDEMNIIYFQDLEKDLPEWPWAFKQKGVKGFDL